MGILSTIKTIRAVKHLFSFLVFDIGGNRITTASGKILYEDDRFARLAKGGKGKKTTGRPRVRRRASARRRSFGIWSAADSLRAVEEGNIMAFRVGGDEFTARTARATEGYAPRRPQSLWWRPP